MRLSHKWRKRLVEEVKGIEKEWVGYPRVLKGRKNRARRWALVQQEFERLEVRDLTRPEDVRTVEELSLQLNADMRM